MQGTGNGYLSRARDIVPVLQEKGDPGLLISDFEPVRCRACISLSHQAAVLSNYAPEPAHTDVAGRSRFEWVQQNLLELIVCGVCKLPLPWTESIANPNR